MRLGCLTIPLFPLAARLRSEPELASEAVAVTTGDGAAARVVAATRRARQSGVRPGLSLTQARARMARLITRARDPECERAAQESLLEVAGKFSPRVEDEDDGRLYLDLEGLDRHFETEEAMGRQMVAAAEAVGLPAHAGIAGSKLAARVAASLPATVTVVAPGGEAEFLAPLPLARLSPHTEVATVLHRWGIRRVGDLARLPADEVVSRLGRAGRDLYAVARGEDPSPLVPQPPSPCFREGSRLEWPLVALEPFLFVLRAALERLCRRLETRGLGCSELGLALHLEPEGQADHRLRLPAPTREVKPLLTLLRLRLESSPPGAPVTGFALTAWPDRPPEAQLSLFGPEALSPGRLAATLARLFALVGPDRVGSPGLVDRHRPERFRMIDFAPPPPPDVPPPPPPAGGRGLLAVRTLRPPVELEVITDAPPDAEPGRLRPLEVQGVGETRPRIRGRVKVSAGPWSLAEQWWSNDEVARDYWDIELSDGGLYRIYRERLDGTWYADGIYD